MAAVGPFPHRSFGVLLHPSSFPGRDHIGTLGTEAHDFVAWLGTTGATLWQILPLTMNGQDDSPYFSSSTFAGNPWLVDLDMLVEYGLLDDTGLPEGVTDATIDFDDVRAHKQPSLRPPRSGSCCHPRTACALATTASSSTPSGSRRPATSSPSRSFTTAHRGGSGPSRFDDATPRR